MPLVCNLRHTSFSSARLRHSKLQLLSQRRCSRCTHRPCMPQAKAGLLVVSAPGTPELKELDALPQQLHIVGVGRSEEDLKGLTEDDWASVQALVNCGVGVNAGKREHLQKLWPRLKNLRWVHSASAGVESLLFPELVDSAVVVTNAKGNYSHSLAEWALTACTWFAKELPRIRANQKAHNWEILLVEELRGTTMGIVGYGSIGQATAGIARAFGMRIIALRRRRELSQEEQQQGLQVYPPDKLNELMADSDYVVASLPYTPATDKLITEEAISHMKSSGVFVNVGRGKTVDEQALIEALKAGRIKGAGLDVFATEPLPEDSPMWDLDNVLVSPHSADRTRTFQYEALQQFCAIAKAFVAGEPLPNQIDKHSGY